MSEGTVESYPKGAHAQISGLASKPELNDEYCVSLGPNPDNPERLMVVTRTALQLSIKPSNLKPAELLPGSQVIMVGLVGAAQYNGKQGEVLSWHGDRWIVDLPNKERKSFKSENLVLLPEKIHVTKRKAEEPPPEAKKLKTSDMKDLESNDESLIARTLVRCIHEEPLIAQKCVCVLATQTSMTVLHELAQHLTNKQNDGLLRRPLKPGEKVKGIEELDAMEQCVLIAEKKVRTLASSVRSNYLELFNFMKYGMREPAFTRGKA